METIQEYICSQPDIMRIDKKSGVIHGVRILGFYSRNGRRYSESCLQESVHLYENARVNVNHSDNPHQNTRDYRDRIGSLFNVTFCSGEGLFADFRYNPKHPLTEQMLWDAEHAPENVGFSHHIEAETVKDGNSILVTAIRRVISVDLVADPATTNGLFESRKECHSIGYSNADPDMHNSIYENDNQVNEEFDFCEKTEELHAEFCACHEMNDRLSESREKNASLQEQLHDLLREKKRSDREILIQRTLDHFGISIPRDGDLYGKTMVSDIFLESLFREEDDQKMRDMVADRSRMINAIKKTLSYEYLHVSNSDNFIHEIGGN
jgi:hypothetical protein